jgi:hypothetical protein
LQKINQDAIEQAINLWAVSSETSEGCAPR